MKNFILSFTLLFLTALTGTAQTYNIDTDGGAIGTGATINGCSGTISEGVGNYGNSESFQITFCAPAGQAIQLNFTTWNVETCCDYLTVYDNSTNSGTQLFYGHGGSNPGVITSTGSCITLTWTTDGSVTYAGWEAAISCYTPGTCSDGVQNQDETGIDCGGTYCYPCSCFNGIQDPGEDGVDCGAVCGTPCPCDVTVTPTPASLPCGGGQVTLVAEGSGSVFYALDNDFNGGSAGVGWNVSPAGQFDNPCDPSVDGGTYMWMGNTTAAPRTLETAPLDVSCGGDICFYLDFATQGGLEPCEGPDLTNEGVYLEYSIDGGTTWVTINYFEPDAGGTTGPYLSWAQYCFPIPPAAQTATTLFHWFQNGSSGTCCDHWGIDNVTISSQNCNPYYYNWDQVAGSGPDDSTQVENIVTTTDFTVWYTNGVDDSCSTTITINVGALDPITVNGTDEICIGDNDGTITIDPATGGTAPYTYEIDDGTNTTTQVGSGAFTGVAPGTYDVTVTDAAGCQSFGTITINPGITCCPMTNTEAFTDVTCNGANDGTITLTENLGAAPVTFSIDNGATTQTNGNFTGLAPGTYNILITDANNCTYTSVIEIDEPPVITITPTVVDATCGLSNGSIDLVGGGGSGSGYTYSIDAGANFQASGSFTGLPAANYDVVVEDGTGCQQTMVVTINNGGAPTIDNVAFTDPTCDGACNGTITITASGGTGAITYSIDNGTNFQASNNFTALCGNTYDIAITDAMGCPAYSSVTLTDPGPIVFDTNITNLLCNSVCNGSIDIISVTGGDGNYQYSSDNGATFQAGSLFGNLCAGTYDLVVEDGNNCVGNMTVAVTEPAPLTLTTNSTDPLCNGACDGTIDLTAGGGIPGYNYSMDNGVTWFPTPNFIGVCDGTYSVVVEDANGCKVYDNVTLTDPPVVSFTTTPVDATCGNANGSIDVTAAGGDGNYQYSNDNGVTFQASNQFNGLMAGNYDIVVIDGNGCGDTNTVAINNLGAPLIDSITTTDPFCSGSCDGTITIYASQGAGGFQYSIDGGATFQASNVFTNQCVGTYNVVVEDMNLCQVNGVTNLVDPAAIVYNVNITNLDCFNQCIGEIEITNVLGGNGTYTYSIDGGATFQAGNTFTTLCAGNYDVVVMDGNNCTATSTETVTEPTQVSFTFTTTANSCNQLNGACDGSIDITPSGGTGAYTYSIDNGATFVGTNVFNSLCAGNYDVVVMDANNCTSTQVVTVTEPTALSFTSTTTTTSCGQSNGSIDFTAVGGTPGYEFSIDNGVSYQLGTVFNGLPAGAYDCCIRDANGCTYCAVVNINNDAAQSIDNIAFTDPSCNGACDGTVTVTVSGGTPPIMYSIDGGPLQISNVFTGICTGTHNILTQDDNGCQALGSVTLTEPAAITYTPALTHLLCFNQCIGVIDLTTTTGGDGNYQYSIDNGATMQASPIFNGLCAGTYNILIQDGNGCIGTGTETITEPTALTLAFSTVDATCNTYCDGSASAIVGGGVTPYDYQWSGGIAGSQDTDANNLCAGTYDLVILDDNGCQIDTMAFVINEPAPFTINNLVVTDELCNGDCSGTIMVDATGATAFSIDSGATMQASQNFNNLCAGTYNIYVENAAGCITTSTATVNSPPVLTLTTDADTTICLGGTATICGYANGGTGAYTYDWDIPAQGQCQTVSPTATSLYRVMVTDANGCTTAEMDVNVIVNPPLQIFAYQDESICPGDTAQIEASAMGGNGGPYTYTWINDQDGTIMNGELHQVDPMVTTTYTAIVNDGCSPPDSASITITVLPTPDLQWTASALSGCDPLTVDFTNNTDPFMTGSCQWDFGNGVISNDCNPTYTFDTPGCYDVTFSVYSPDGCKSDTILTNYICVSEVPTPDFSFGPQPTTILDPYIEFTNLSTGATNYVWDFGYNGDIDTVEVDPGYLYPDDSAGNYQVCLTAISIDGCDSTICYNVLIEDEFLMYVPNAFTADGNGVNDVFLPNLHGYDPLSYELMIFNRWGDLIFQSAHPSIGWDGTYKGAPAQTDVYVWKIRVKDQIGGEFKDYIGHVTLLR